MLLPHSRLVPTHRHVVRHPGRGQWAARAVVTHLSPKHDVVSLGNLCVDVVVPVPELPPADTNARRQLLEKLTAAPADESAWEVGGNCNFIIAAARLGLKVGTVGHVGTDVYGRFMRRVLQEESVRGLEDIATADTLLQQQAARQASGAQASSSSSNGAPDKRGDTLVCFVLVDPCSKHAFCSRYDFGPWPLLSDIKQLAPGALQMLRSSRAVFTNGFVFDELDLGVVCGAAREAIAHGAAIFFDPGPRCFTMKEGARRVALDAVMDLSDVVLMTEEEAAVVTGLSDPEAAAKWVLARPGAKTEWCVVKLGGAGALLASKSQGSVTRSRGIQVEVQDTVGCGDSFASAVVLGYINKYSIPSTLALANAVGAATAMGRGAGRNVARAERVMHLLSAQDRQEHVSEAISILQMSIDGA
mmetsp:Transcript_2991/g.7381  ORF Transcript_2991/g.7381 Transcript_2991/m.7381 type:complete len:416 (-) Transcript_2991:319-1566(-)